MDSTPLYARVVNDLARRVQLGEFPAESQIPTEDALCGMYGVSRITVRKALEQLVARRLLVRRRGVGTFVAPRPAPGKSVRLYGHLADMRTWDYRHTHRVVERGPAEPPAAVARLFDVDEPLYRIASVNDLDGAVYSVTEFWFAPAYAELAARMDLGRGKQPIQVLEESVGVQVKRVEQTLEAEVARAPVADQLGLKRGTAVLRAERTYYGTDDLPLEFVVIRYHPERFRVGIELALPGK